jgi:acyl-CoA thioester hydrolase
MPPHVTEYRVIYGDSDPFDVVYYANYFDFFERGRTELFRSLGMTYKDISGQGIFLPVSETFCKYHKSARYDDLLQIETSIAYLKRVSIRFDYKIYTGDPRSLVAEGYTVHAFVNREGRIKRAPQAVIDKVKSLVAAEMSEE